MTHELAWTSPQPFWSGDTGELVPAGQLARPRILRFASDDFMQDLLSTLEHDPSALARFEAAAETWRGPGAAPAPDPQRWQQREPAAVLGLRRKARQRQRAVESVQAKASSGLPATAPEAEPLKLYQPAQMRHYLVCGALVCRSAGLPDRRVDPARQKVSFVVRRLLPRSPLPPGQPLPDPTQRALWDEYAYVPRGKAGAWKRVAAADDEAAAARLQTDEERLGTFPAHFVPDDGQRRRMFVGSVPVGRRETYQGAPAEGAAGTGASGATGAGASPAAMDPRLVLFHTQVLGPWRALVNRVMGNGTIGGDPDHGPTLRAARPTWVFARDGDGFNPSLPDAATLRATRSGLVTSSWYLLLDLYLFLREYLKDDFLDVVMADGVPDGAAGELYQAMAGARMPEDLPLVDQGLSLLGGIGSMVELGGAYQVTHVELDLIAALRRIAAFEAALEAAGEPFEIPAPGAGAVRPAGWPDYLFLFADPWFGVLQPAAPGYQPRTGEYLAENIQARIDTLAALVQAALPPVPADKPLPEPALASMQPADLREAWYLMRLVYERPDCTPFHDTVVSAATRPFRMAGFFDPDAPARPIRIGLPLDTSPAGLRKFDKGAVFVLSDMLCGQIDRMKGLGLGDLIRSVLPWPFHKPLDVPSKGACKTGDGLSLGVMCSLSIPIVTICALLLLLIIATLLDYIFRWLPYLICCFPLPGLRGKKDGPS